jgi:hypothetical protein
VGGFFEIAEIGEFAESARGVAAEAAARPILSLKRRRCVIAVTVGRGERGMVRG